MHDRRRPRWPRAVPHVGAGRPWATETHRVRVQFDFAKPRVLLAALSSPAFSPSVEEKRGAEGATWGAAVGIETSSAVQSWVILSCTLLQAAGDLDRYKTGERQSSDSSFQGTALAWTRHPRMNGRRNARFWRGRNGTANRYEKKAPEAIAAFVCKPTHYESVLRGPCYYTNFTIQHLLTAVIFLRKRNVNF